MQGDASGTRRPDVLAADAASRQLDRTFGALAHPARRAILTRLAHGPATATELGAPLTMSQPGVSKHLKALEQAGLIARGRDAQWRPCELRTDALIGAQEWVVGFRRTWEQRLDGFGTYLESVQSGGHRGETT